MGIEGRRGAAASLEWERQRLVGRTIPSAGAAPSIDEAARYACAPRHEKEGPDVLTDIEIAQATEPKPIGEIAAIAGVDEKYLELYGNYKAKVDYNLLREEEHAPGKLILVTAINPTPAGEGKTTTTVGLADALSLRGKNVVVALREPSLGPVFGIKGGAAGGGYAQVIPMEDINLHFTRAFKICANN